MPLTGYLKIGDIAGESTVVEHEDEIDIFGVSWEVEQASLSGRSGRARARADMGPLVVHKFFDASSPYIAQAVEQGRSFPDMVLTLRKDSGDAALDYLIITMENCLIVSYSFANEGPPHPDGLLVERAEIDFERIQIEYAVQNDTHEVSLGGSPRSVSLRARAI